MAGLPGEITFPSPFQPFCWEPPPLSKVFRIHHVSNSSCDLILPECRTRTWVLRGQWLTLIPYWADWHLALHRRQSWMTFGYTMLGHCCGPHREPAPARGATGWSQCSFTLVPTLTRWHTPSHEEWLVASWVKWVTPVPAHKGGQGNYPVSASCMCFYVSMPYHIMLPLPTEVLLPCRFLGEFWLCLETQHTHLFLVFPFHIGLL